jgi:hypothetical protein
MTGAGARVATNSLLSLPARFPLTALAPDLAVVGMAIAFAVAISSAPLGSGDYGQWLMVSRLYAGEDVPAYRELGGIAPVVPALLGLIRIFVDDPFVALNALRIVMLTWLIMGFYLAGTAIFGSRSGGLLAAIVPMLMTYQFLELFAFGGVLQAASIVFLLLAMAALALAARGSPEERAWWTTAALCAGLAILSHTGSVVVIVPSLLAAASVVLLRRGARDWRAWPRRLAPAALVAAIPALYWAVVLAPANSSYATNPASLAYRGPDRLFDPLFEPGLTLTLILAGVVSLGFGAGRCIRRRRVDGYALVAAWAAATWAVTVAASAAGAATDYPRFSPLLLAPLAVAAAGGVAEVAALVDRRMARSGLPVHAPIAVAALLLLVLGPRQIDTFHGRAEGYALQDQDGIRAAAHWLDVHLPDGQTVIATSNREGKWFEGLTGEEALFAGPVRYSFRASEWERTLAATSVTRSTTAVVNGAWLGMFSANADAGRVFVPVELLLAMNHDGEYIDVAELPDTEAYVMRDGRPFATLANLDPVDVERIADDHRVAVRTTWTGVREGVTVNWVREVSLEAGSEALVVRDSVSADVPLDGIVVSVRPEGQYPLLSTLADATSATLRFASAGQRPPLLVVSSPTGAHLASTGPRVVATGGTEMTLQLTAATAGSPIGNLSLLYPPQVLEDYGVGAAIVNSGPATEERVERLRALGFTRELRAGEYLLMVRENAVGRPTSAPADEDGGDD